MSKSVKDIALVFFPTFLAGLFSFIAGVLTRNMLPPETFGVWLTFQMFILYGVFLQFGILNGIHREIPILLGKQDNQKAHYLRELAFLTTIFLLFVVIISCILIMMLPLTSEIRILSTLTLISIVGQQFLTFGRIIYITVADFKKVAIVQLINGPIQSILSIILVYTIGLYGMFLSIIIANIIGAFYAVVKFRPSLKLKVRIELKQLFSLIKIGFPLLLTSFSYLLLISVDRLFILTFMSSEELGLYSLAILVFQTLIMLPQVIDQVYFSKIGFRIGRNEDPSLIYKTLDLIVFLVSIGLPLILGLIYYFLPKFVSLILPQYVGGIFVATMMLLVVYFLSVNAVYASFLKIINQQKKYLLIIIVVVVINFLLCLLFYKSNMGLLGVILSSVVASFIYYICILTTSFKYMGRNKLFGFKKFLANCTPVFLSICIIISLNYMNIDFILKSVTFAIIYLSIIIILFKKQLGSLKKNSKLTFMSKYQEGVDEKSSDINS